MGQKEQSWKDNKTRGDVIIWLNNERREEMEMQGECV